MPRAESSNKEEGQGDREEEKNTPVEFA